MVDLHKLLTERILVITDEDWSDTDALVRELSRLDTGHTTLLVVMDFDNTAIKSVAKQLNFREPVDVDIAFDEVDADRVFVFSTGADDDTLEILDEARAAGIPVTIFDR